MIKSSVRRGADLVQQILAFARGSDSEKVNLEVKSFLKDALRLIRSTFPKNIKVELDVDPNLPPLHGNPTHLHQLLLNLCVNARDAMPKGGTLSITVLPRQLTSDPVSNQPLVEPGLYILIEIADSGTGIPTTELGKIFDPFFTTKKPGHGTGLGLATVRSIVDSHRGFLQVKSAVGKGSTFSVYLPSGQGTVLLNQPVPVKDLHGSSELILLVEDEVSLSTLTQVALESHNYRVISACTAEEAVQHIRNAMDVKLIIADWQLPGESGLDLISRLRRQNPRLKAICATGFEDQSDPSLGLKDAVALLRKPFSTQDLLTKVKESLSSGTKVYV